MIDGPGPPVTSRVTVRPVPPSVARICSESVDCRPSRETHRILLLRSESGGARNGSCSAHRMATMFP